MGIYQVVGHRASSTLFRNPPAKLAFSLDFRAWAERVSRTIRSQTQWRPGVISLRLAHRTLWIDLTGVTTLPGGLGLSGLRVQPRLPAGAALLGMIGPTALTDFGRVVRPVRLALAGIGRPMGEVVNCQPGRMPARGRVMLHWLSCVQFGRAYETPWLSGAKLRGTRCVALCPSPGLLG